MSKRIFIGVDGCRTGWFAVFLDIDEGKRGKWDIGLFSRFQDLIDFLNKEHEKVDFFSLIDIPIGLKTGGSGERLSDVEVRRLLKARKSSIFPVPCRGAIYAENYGKACETNKKFTGKSISKQAWNIIPKIRDVDTFLIEKENVRDRVKETAPEICFQAFAGYPMQYSKKDQKGFLERKEVLKPFCPFTDEIVETALSRYRRKELVKDDILDALVLAITTKMGYSSGFEYVPFQAETDSKGIEIQILYYRPFYLLEC